MWAESPFLSEYKYIAMNKASLVEKVQAEYDLTKAQAEQLIEDLFDSIVKEVASGEAVSIAGFGIFEAKKRAARMGRNPKTGEAIQIKASINPKFRPAKAFKDAVNT